MERVSSTPVVAADAPAVTEVVAALESSLYGQTTFSQADLEDEWSELDLSRDARVVRAGGLIVGYGVVRERGDAWRVEGYVHPDALGRGFGSLIATGLEADAAQRGAHRVQNSVLEADSAARTLLESLGYSAVRIFREMRIDLETPPAPPDWPEGLRAVPFDPEHDAREFHAAHQEAFADAWDFTPRDFESWSELTLKSQRFDPALWCLVRAEGEIAGGTICTADTYGGGFVHALFVRRPWRKRGVGAALLADSFGRFWERGEHSVGLGVDAESATGAFHLYERAGMAPALGWVTYEKELTPRASTPRGRSPARPGASRRR
jgi:GNAT superfamily N-acetyltransferase